ncbi:MAG: hypothetical protein ACRYGG_21035 [Janthinobacterium lividum]
MASIASIVASASRVIAGALGVEVTYRRGPSLWVKLTAVPAASAFATTTDGQVTGDYRTRDFLIDKCDLTLSGTAVEPQRGDTIDMTVGNRTHTYAVSSPPHADQVWRFSDLSDRTVRVHTVLQGIADR